MGLHLNMLLVRHIILFKFVLLIGYWQDCDHCTETEYIAFFDTGNISERDANLGKKITTAPRTRLYTGFEKIEGNISCILTLRYF